MIKKIINKIYGLLVDLSKIFSRKDLDYYIKNNIENLNDIKRVLIVGAGGRINDLVYRISVEKSFELFSLDIEKQYNPDIIADITDYDFNNDKYDVIIISEVLQFIPDPQKAINNIYRGLNKNGIMILTVPFIYPIHDRPYDYYRFTKYALHHLLSKFSEVEVIEKNSWSEAINVLHVRHIMNQNISSKFISIIYLLFGYIFYPINYLLGKLIKTDYITSGYNVRAKK